MMKKLRRNPQLFLLSSGRMGASFGELLLTGDIVKAKSASLPLAASARCYFRFLASHLQTKAVSLGFRLSNERITRAACGRFAVGV